LLERLAIPNLTVYIVIGQAVVFCLALANFDLSGFYLVPALVLEGEWPRLLSFLFTPPDLGIRVFTVFALILFWLYGSALEAHWGVVRYNLFILTGWVLTVAVAFITPEYPTTNYYLGLVVFLAFARILPEFELLLYFILPIKVKWLALMTWAIIAYAFISNGLPTRLAILAAVANFLLFFARDIYLGLRFHKRRVVREVQRATTRDDQPNTCRVCGRSPATHPTLDFRFCSQCEGEQCYCEDHIRDHNHVVADSAAAPSG
jgi:hypothetical protein